MSKRRLPREAKLRLLVLLAVGGGIGALAAIVSVRGIQLALVGVAVCLGVYTGLTIRQARNSKQ